MNDIDVATFRAAHAASRADERAQRRFRAMCQARAWSNPDADVTRRYIEAERLLDRLHGEPHEHLGAFEISVIGDCSEWVVRGYAA